MGYELLDYTIYKNKIKSFLSSEELFLIVNGKEGIGKTTCISETLKENAGCVLHIPAQFFTNSYPLISICAALRCRFDCSYQEVLNKISALPSLILFVEEPHYLLKDDGALLLTALRYRLHLDARKTKIILEFNGSSRETCFTLLQSPHNSSFVEFASPSASVFEAIVHDLIHGPAPIIKEIASYAQGSFKTLNEIVLFLSERGFIIQAGDGFECHGTIPSRIVLDHKRNKALTKYESLEAALQQVARYSALMGKMVLSTLLSEALGVENPEQKLELLSTDTSWISETDLHNWNLLFTDTRVFAFADPGVHNLLRSRSDKKEKDDYYLKLAHYLEYKLATIHKDDINTIWGMLLSMLGEYYSHSNREKSVYFFDLAGDFFSNYGNHNISIEHYQQCFTYSVSKDEKIKYLKLLIAENIHAEKANAALELIFGLENELISDPEIQFLYAEALYLTGYPDQCLAILLKLCNTLPRWQVDYFAFQIHSLLASVYDWTNDPVNRRKHFRHAENIANRLKGDQHKMAISLLNKKCNLIYNFTIPEVQKRMKDAMQFFLDANEYGSAYECSHNIGVSYMYMMEFDQAKFYIDKALDGFERQCSKQIYVPINSRGILLMIKGNYKEAFACFSSINEGIIEPFCMLCVIVNRIICMLKLNHDRASLIKAFMGIRCFEEKAESSNELLLPYVNLLIAKAFFYLREGYAVNAKLNFSKAYRLCDSDNSNFDLARDISGYHINLMENNCESAIDNMSHLSIHCAREHIIFGDFLFWR